MIEVGYTTNTGLETISESCESIADANVSMASLKETLSTRDDIAELFMQRQMPNDEDELVMQKFAWLDPE